MKADGVIDAYRRALSEDGNAEPVVVRRYTGASPSRSKFDVDVMARVSDYKASELVGDIKQGDRRVIVLAVDLIDGKFPIPVAITDRIVIRGKECSIQSLDDSSRRVGTTLIAYEARVRG